ncbi:MAG: hypothetical protein KDA28_07880 [Phycisphaerales bacterium]|nr:hypothetical protein [Phycisphaerales bacterium]
MSRRRQSPLPTIAAIVLAVAFSVSLYANWSLANTGKFTLPGMANPVLAYEAPKPVEPVDQPEMVAILVPSKDLEPFDVVTSAIF